MESNARNKTRLTGRRFQHHKTISEGSINDSGYHSGVFTSPEFTRSLGNIHNASGPNIENLTFDGPIKRARFTSTPLNISTKKNFDFSFPSPKLSDDRASAISVCESSSDCVFLSNIEKSELVIISEIPPSSSLDVPKTKPKTSGSRVSIAKTCDILEEAKERSNTVTQRSRLSPLRGTETP
ncbi:hypothetical protein SK128_011978 [Halocaridina rubra]|uniref:Uncharacterized protein n=1 Tax=Halocaridina rubra TaxID=373956 RepID=A0AAN8XFU1_HALRR